MGSRQLNRDQFSNLPSTMQSPVRYEATMLPHGTDPPTMGEGDPRESYMKPSRTGVGAYSITTVDPYAAVIRASFGVMAANPAAVQVLSVTRNADKTITVAVQVFTPSTGAALELDAAGGDALFCEIVLRNTDTGAP